MTTTDRLTRRLEPASCPECGSRDELESIERMEVLYAIDVDEDGAFRFPGDSRDIYDTVENTAPAGYMDLWCDACDTQFRATIVYDHDNEDDDDRTDSCRCNGGPLYCDHCVPRPPFVFRNDLRGSTVCPACKARHFPTVKVGPNEAWKVAYEGTCDWCEHEQELDFGVST